MDSRLGGNEIMMEMCPGFEGLMEGFCSIFP
jgi:hypothetical protein